MHQYLLPNRMVVCLVFFVVLSFAAGSLSAVEYQEDVSNENYLFAKGIVHSVSVAEQTLTIKVKKGPSLVLSIGQDTLLEGFYRLDELTARDTIKVWYQPGKPHNRALKIVKPLELGC